MSEAREIAQSIFDSLTPTARAAIWHEGYTRTRIRVRGRMPDETQTVIDNITSGLRTLSQHPAAPSEIEYIVAYTMLNNPDVAIPHGAYDTEDLARASVKGLRRILETNDVDIAIYRTTIDRLPG